MTAALEDLDVRALLDRARTAQRAVRVAEADVLLATAAWADAHPRLDDHGHPVAPSRPDQDALAAHFAGIDEHADLDTPSWAGLPPVAWSAPAALGTALDLSTPSARTLLRDVLVLRHRLPLIWARTRRAEVPAWRARQIATAVAGAPDDVCAAIDTHLAPRAHAVGAITLDKTIGVAMARLHPEEVERASWARLTKMHVTIHLDQVSFDGLSDMDARADYADLARLDQTLSALAARLHQVDDTVDPSDPLPYRRAKALRWLADPTAAAALLTTTPEAAAPPTPPAPTPPAPTPPAPAPQTKATLVVHLTPEGFTGSDPVALVSTRLGGTTHAMLTDVVADWLGRTGTTLTLTPVVHLSDGPTTTDAAQDLAEPDPGYRPTAATRRAVLLRDPTCRFPWCTRPSAGCDLDHVRPWPHGPTHPDNLIPLCRHHHRLKTLAGYTVDVLVPGTLTWTTPHGDHHLVDRDGTHRLDLPPHHPLP